MKVRTKVRVDIDDKLMDRRAEQADKILAQQAMKDTDRFVPALTGSLSQRTRVKGSQIIYPGPYARFLYHGKLMVDPDTGSPWAQPGATKTLTDRNLVFSKAMHADAQAEWFEASKAVNLNKWKKVYKDALGNDK